MSDTTTVDPDALFAEILLTPEGKADPYPRYAAIREHAPAFRSATGVVVLSRFEDCQFLLRDPRFGKGERGAVWEQYELTEDEWMERFESFATSNTSMLGLDPPDHTRLRKLVSKAFTPRTVERLRPEIVRITDELLDRFDLTAPVDVVADLALQVPMAVIGEMLGVPEADRVALQPLIRAAVATLEFNPPLDVLEAAAVAARAITARFEELIAERRAQPTDDLLSELVHVEEEGDQLTHDELLSTVILIYGAGFETTTNLIGNGLLALLEHPDQLQRLRGDRSLLRNAVDELLRWDSPVQLDGRQAFEAIDLHGLEIAAGEELVTMLGSANRDPRVFDDPDRLDVGREGSAPLSFGSGIHYCLGASLARAEGQVVFDRLLDRFSTIEPAWGDEPPRYRDSIVLRGLESLPVVFARD
ncbi:MAG: cytochrome P450 [Acidimicrobiia bacterium]|nr:cytochrome P450 [Acidimicrobiia bacterium]